MTIGRWRTRVLVATALGLGIGLCASQAAGLGGIARDDAPSKTPVTLAEVASRVEGKATTLPNVVELLRSDVETEIAAIDWSKSGIRKRYTVSAAIVRLESTRDRSSSRTNCTVSATLRDAKSGTLLAIVEGRAEAEDRPAAIAAAERGALAGAAKGAVTALPEAIRRTAR